MRKINMKKTFLALALILSALSLQAQTMRELWTSMPDSIVPYLNNSLRTELADYKEMKVTAAVKNLLGDTTTIEQMTAHYMSVKLNSTSELELRKLDNNTFAMVRTLYTPEAESELTLYNTDWTTKPCAIDYNVVWAKPDTMSQAEYDELYSKVGLKLYKLKLSDKDNAITLSVSTPLAEKTDKEKIKTITREKQLVWNGNTFK